MTKLTFSLKSERNYTESRLICTINYDPANRRIDEVLSVRGEEQMIIRDGNTIHHGSLVSSVDLTAIWEGDVLLSQWVESINWEEIYEEQKYMEENL